jgi:hypothetical protein
VICYIEAPIKIGLNVVPATIAALRPRREIGGDGSLSVSDSLEFGNELVLLPDCREIILAIIYIENLIYTGYIN